ncbi:MAG: PTS sugar transporter subunit IIA [Erysipelotrichaceae bacterium]
MELKDVLDKNLVKIGLDVKNKDDALHQLANVLCENGYIDDVSIFVKDIYLREEEGVTGIGNGIAIPHGKSDSAQRPGIAIARLKNPIKWETLDGNDVDTIFLFCVSTDANFARNHMLMLSKVAAKIADDDLLERVKTSTTSEQLISYMTGELE